MSEAATEHMFVRMLDAINYARKEFSVSTAEILGTLRMVTRAVEDDAMERDDEKCDLDTTGRK